VSASDCYSGTSLILIPFFIDLGVIKGNYFPFPLPLKVALSRELLPVLLLLLDALLRD